MEKVNKAVSKLIMRGSMNQRLSAAVTELASPGLANIPAGETRELWDWIFAAVTATRPSSMEETEAERVTEAIWELRARLEGDEANARRAA